MSGAGGGPDRFGNAWSLRGSNLSKDLVESWSNELLVTSWSKVGQMLVKGSKVGHDWSGIGQKLANTWPK